MNSLCNLPEVLAIAGMKAVDIGGLKLKVPEGLPILEDLLGNFKLVFLV